MTFSRSEASSMKDGLRAGERGQHAGMAVIVVAGGVQRFLVDRRGDDAADLAGHRVLTPTIRRVAAGWCRRRRSRHRGEREGAAPCRGKLGLPPRVRAAVWGCAAGAAEPRLLGRRRRELRRAAGSVETGSGFCLSDNSRDGLNRELSYPVDPADAGRGAARRLHLPPAGDQVPAARRGAVNAAAPRRTAQQAAGGEAEVVHQPEERAGRGTASNRSTCSRRYRPALSRSIVS